MPLIPALVQTISTEKFYISTSPTNLQFPTAPELHSALTFIHHTDNAAGTSFVASIVSGGTATWVKVADNSPDPLQYVHTEIWVGWNASPADQNVTINWPGTHNKDAGLILSEFRNVKWTMSPVGNNAVGSQANAPLVVGFGPVTSSGVDSLILAALGHHLNNPFTAPTNGFGLVQYRSYGIFTKINNVTLFSKISAGAGPESGTANQGITNNNFGWAMADLLPSEIIFMSGSIDGASLFVPSSLDLIREVSGSIFAQGSIAADSISILLIEGSIDAQGSLLGSLLRQVENGGFEIPGLEPGDADGWSILQKASIDEYASFAGELFDFAFEGFEQAWQNDDFRFAFVGEPTDLERSLFLLTNKGTEDFEEGWLNNQLWSDSLVSVDFADFDTTIPEPVEDFEDEWNNDAFLSYLTPVFLNVITAAAGFWSVIINGVVIGATADALDNEAAIRDKLVTAIDAANVPVDASAAAGTRLQLDSLPINSFWIVDADQITVPAGGAFALEADDKDATKITEAVFNVAMNTVEAFEVEWRDNQNFKFAFVGPPTDLTFAEFDDDLGPTVQYEDFENGWPTIVMKTI